MLFGCGKWKHLGRQRLLQSRALARAEPSRLTVPPVHLQLASYSAWLPGCGRGAHFIAQAFAQAKADKHELLSSYCKVATELGQHQAPPTGLNRWPPLAGAASSYLGLHCRGILIQGNHEVVIIVLLLIISLLLLLGLGLVCQTRHARDSNSFSA